MMFFLRNTIFFNHYCAFIQEKSLSTRLHKIGFGVQDNECVIKIGVKKLRLL
jgi:hypothetical protein